MDKQNTNHLKDLDLQLMQYKIALFKDISYKLYNKLKLLEEASPDTLNTSSKELDNITELCESKKLPLASKQKVPFPQEKKKNDIDRNNITTNKKSENIYDKLQAELAEITNATLQKIAREEEAKKNVSERIDHYTRPQFVTEQLPCDAPLSKNNVRKIKRAPEQLESNKEKFENIESIKQQITRNLNTIGDMNNMSIADRIFKLEKQQNERMTEESCREKENVRIKHQKYEEESDDQEVTYVECKSEMHKILVNKITTLSIEKEWWQKSFKNKQIELMKTMTEKLKTEMELAMFAAKTTALQNLCDTFEKEKFDLLLQQENKNNNASLIKSVDIQPSQEDILQESQQRSLERNNVKLDLQKTLKKQVPKVVAKGTHKDITLPPIMRRQPIMKEDYIAFPTINIARTEANGILESSKQVNTALNTDSFTQIMAYFENKMRNMLNKDLPIIMKLLEDSKVNDIVINDESIVAKEQVSTLAKEFNNDCIKPSLIPCQMPIIDYDNVTSPSISSIDNDSDKSKMSSNQTDKNSDNDCVESLKNCDFENRMTHFENKMCEILNKVSVKISKLLDNLKIDDKSSVTSSSTSNSEQSDLSKDSNKTEEPSKQIDDALIKLLINFEEDANKILNVRISKKIELFEDVKTYKSIVVEEEIQNKDKIADKKKEIKRGDTIFNKNIIFSLPYYDPSLYNTTRNQSVVKTTTNRESRNQSKPKKDLSFNNVKKNKIKIVENTNLNNSYNETFSYANDIDAILKNNKTMPKDEDDKISSDEREREITSENKYYKVPHIIF